MVKKIDIYFTDIHGKDNIAPINITNASEFNIKAVLEYKQEEGSIIMKSNGNIISFISAPDGIFEELNYDINNLIKRYIDDAR